MSNNMQEPTNGGSVNSLYFETNEENKVIDANKINVINLYNNPEQQQEEIIGINPVVIKLIAERQEEQGKTTQISGRGE